MDFVTGLPRFGAGCDAIWVIVDRLTKSAHFLAIKETWGIDRLVELYIKEVVRLHGIPVSIISDRDPRFTLRLWEKLHLALGTRLKFSTAYHPQTNGQSERTIQTLEHLLRACVLDLQSGERKNWEAQLGVIEFA